MQYRHHIKQKKHMPKLKPITIIYEPQTNKLEHNITKQITNKTARQHNIYKILQHTNTNTNTTNNKTKHNTNTYKIQNTNTETNHYNTNCTNILHYRNTRILTITI